MLKLSSNKKGKLKASISSVPVVEVSCPDSESGLDLLQTVSTKITY